MIPVLLVLAVAYWLAAPDPVTAGARTASGTGVAAAGAGIRDHWSSGRDSRALTRTKRRDRWSKGGGFWRNLLRLEHGAVITGKGVKGAAGITRAAVKPVPAAVKAGWVSGRDRHRAKAGNRPVPVALDPPWWRREQPQVQPGEQAPEHAEDQVGDSPAEQVQDSGGHSPEQAQEQPGDSPQIPDWDTRTNIPPEWRCQRCDSGRYRYTYDGIRVCSACAADLDRLADDGPEEQPLDTEEQIRSRRTPAWNRAFPEPLTESDRRFWTARDAGDVSPLDRDGRPGDPDQWPFKTDPDPTDTTTEQTAGVSPDGSVIEVGKSTSRCGTCWLHVDPESKACPHCSAPFIGISSDYPEFDPQVAAIRPDLPLIRRNAHPVGAEATGGSVNNIPTELRDHVRVQDFAAQIDNLSESSDFVVVAEKARTVGENSRTGGFGREMDLAVDSLEETARRFAVSVDDFREKAHDLAKTSRSVQGS